MRFFLFPLFHLQFQYLHSCSINEQWPRFVWRSYPTSLHMYNDWLVTCSRNMTTETIFGNVPPFVSQPQPQIFRTTFELEMRLWFYRTKVPLFTRHVNTEGVGDWNWVGWHMRVFLSLSNHSGTDLFLMRGNGFTDLISHFLGWHTNFTPSFRGMCKHNMITHIFSRFSPSLNWSSNSSLALPFMSASFMSSRSLLPI